MSAATHCSRCGDLIAALSGLTSDRVVGYFCSAVCVQRAEADPGRHNPFAVPARNREQAGSLTPPALAADVVVPLGAATSVAATFADRFRASARRFDGMHPRPDLVVEHLTAAECEQLADELQRLTGIDLEWLGVLANFRQSITNTEDALALCEKMSAQYDEVSKLAQRACEIAEDALGGEATKGIRTELARVLQ